NDNDHDHHDDDDHSSLQSMRPRPLARLDRLLRRWLPGYSFLRGPLVAESSSCLGQLATEPRGMRQGVAQPAPSLSGRQQQQQDEEEEEETPRLQKRKDGEVVLDTGIAKSEFCMKLEKLLRAKMIAKE
ncbi:hypothetical protein KR044_007004, partial [Drosophila immigrans]